MPKVRRQKLDKYTERIIFVGYQNNSENYQLIDLKNFKITTNIEFIEDKDDFDFQKSVGAV